MLKLKQKHSSFYIFLLISFLLILSLNFFGEIFHGLFFIGFTDEIGILLLFILGFLLLLLKKKIMIYHRDFIILFLVLSIIYVLFYRETWLSFIYEYYKLFVFTAAIPIFQSITKKNTNDLLLDFRKFFIIVLAVNFIFIILQILTNNQVLGWIGYNEIRVSSAGRIGRYTGLFDVGTLGASALLIMLFNELHPKRKFNYYFLHVLGIISVLFSSSKTSYMIFLLWIILYFRRYLLKHLLKIAIGIAAFLGIVFMYTYKAIFSKIDQYLYLFHNIDNPKVVNLSIVEMRAMFWAQSIAIFVKNPFGLGFGTFGDASVKFNPNAYKMPKNMWPEQIVKLSDSSLSHLIAEQGFVTLLYLTLIVIPLVTCKGYFRKFSIMLLVFYLVQIPFTMGFSSGTWPILFAVLYAIFYYANKFEGFYEEN